MSGDLADHLFRFFELDVGLSFVAKIACLPVIPFHFDFTVELDNGAKLVRTLTRYALAQSALGCAEIGAPRSGP